MSWRHYLFGLSGRINRLRYWQFALVSILFYIPAILVAAPYIVIEHPNAAEQGRRLSPLAIATFAGEGLVVIAFLAAGFAVLTKRLHDRNKSAWWLILFLGVPVLMSRVSDPDARHLTGTSPKLALAFLFAAFAVNLWGLVEIGFLRGTRGDNRFGPDPLAPQR